MMFDDVQVQVVKVRNGAVRQTGVQALSENYPPLPAD